MHFSYCLVPAPEESWQREEEMLGTMTQLFLRQILRAGLLICQEMAKHHYIQDQTVRSSPYITSRTVSNTHIHTHTHTHTEKSLSHVQLFATPWIVAHQAPRSMGFSRHEYWSGLPFPSSTLLYKYMSACSVSCCVKLLVKQAQNQQRLL